MQAYRAVLRVPTVYLYNVKDFSSCLTGYQLQGPLQVRVMHCRFTSLQNIVIYVNVNPVAYKTTLCVSRSRRRAYHRVCTVYLSAVKQLQWSSLVTTSRKQFNVSLELLYRWCTHCITVAAAAAANAAAAAVAFIMHQSWLANGYGATFTVRYSFSQKASSTQSWFYRNVSQPIPTESVTRYAAIM